MLCHINPYYIMLCLLKSDIKLNIKNYIILFKRIIKYDVTSCVKPYHVK